MRILDRYILKSMVGLFFGCLFIFLFLYVIIDLFALLGDILEHKTAWSVVVQYYLQFLPVIFVQVAPVACLLSTLYTFGKLNRNNELIAMRSAGLSIMQVSRTVLIFGILVSIAVFWLNDRFVPQALSNSKKIKRQVETGNKPIPGQEKAPVDNLTMYGHRNRLYFINRFYPSTNTMEGIIILEHDSRQNITKKIVANKGIYKDNTWRFFQSITYHFDENGQVKDEPQFLEEEIMPISETPREFLTQRQRAEFMNIAQLDDYLWKLSKSGATRAIRNFKVDLYERLSYPLTSIIIILLGIPFSFVIRKRAVAISSVGIAMLVGFLYYVLTAMGIALGKAGYLPPFLAAFASHLIAFLTALFLISALP